MLPRCPKAVSVIILLAIVCTFLNGIVSWYLGEIFAGVKEAQMRIEIIGDALSPDEYVGPGQLIVCYCALIGGSWVFACKRCGLSWPFSAVLGSVFMVFTFVTTIVAERRHDTVPVSDIILGSLTAVGKANRLAPQIKRWSAEEIEKRPYTERERRDGFRTIDYDGLPRFVSRAFPNHYPIIRLYPSSAESRFELLLEVGHGHENYGLLVVRSNSLPVRSTHLAEYREIAPAVYAYFSK